MPSTPRYQRYRGVVPIIVLNWNGLADTCECVDAVLRMTGASFRVIVIDNGSGGNDHQALAERYGGRANVEVRANPVNLGFTRGMNAVLDELLQDTGAAADYAALLNNDAVPDPGWLAALLDAAQATGAGAVASRMVRYDDPATLDNAGHLFLNTGEILPRGAGQPAEHFDRLADVAGVCAGACLLRTSMLRDIGIFDEFFDTGYEDAELGLRAMLAGYRQVYAPQARVRHKISASIDKVRDMEYAVRLQVNINYSYLKLMPWAVMLWNSPWVLLKTFALLTVPLVCARPRLLRVQWRALLRSFRLLPSVPQFRRRGCAQRISSLQLARRQRCFVGYYWSYFKRFVLGGQMTVFERY